MKHLIILAAGIFALGFPGCKEKTTDHAEHREAAERETGIYTCPMHPEIIRDKPGSCPICGMTLVKKESGGEKTNEPGLNTLLKPTNQYAISQITLAAATYSEEPIEVNVLGYTAYNTNSAGTISARVSGRVERLYIRYRFQKISKGQRIMDIYSPELITAQQNLLLVMRADPGNSAMISAAKQRVLLLGVTEQQVEQVMRTGNPILSVPIYSNYSGHVHETEITGTLMPQAAQMQNRSLTTGELNLKEGMYVQKGQPVFTVFNPASLWILLNIYPQDQAYVKPGNRVKIVPESNPALAFTSKINYIEPFFRTGNKTIVARVNFYNSGTLLPVGSQVKATIYPGFHKGLWLPREAILSLGSDKIVFLKSAEGFRVHKIETGPALTNKVMVLSGLTPTDSVASNAQYLADSESFLRITED